MAKHVGLDTDEKVLMIASKYRKTLLMEKILMTRETWLVMARHGLKGKTITQLKAIRSSDSASPRQKQLAHWRINMTQGKQK